jgi:hypothetical protein
MNATPAGLEYTPSSPMAASREGFLKKSILWFVLVRIPPAKALTDDIMKTATAAKIFFILVKQFLLKAGAKVRLLHKTPI